MHAQVQKGAVVAAGAVVTPGKTVASGEVWAGSPAKLLRLLEAEEAGFIAQAAVDYAALAAVHAAENAKTTEEIQVCLGGFFVCCGEKGQTWGSCPA